MDGHICQECRVEVAADARRCPHCGFNAAAELEKKAKYWRWSAGILGLVALLGVFIIPPLGIGSLLLAALFGAQSLYYSHHADLQTVAEQSTTE